MEDVPYEYRTDFASENDEYARKMEGLKQEIREKCPSSWILDNYPCTWKGASDGTYQAAQLFTETSR